MTENGPAQGSSGAVFSFQAAPICGVFAPADLAMPDVVRRGCHHLIDELHMRSVAKIKPAWGFARAGRGRKA